jgi:hypothetical protein
MLSMKSLPALPVVRQVRDIAAGRDLALLGQAQEQPRDVPPGGDLRGCAVRRVACAAKGISGTGIEQKARGDAAAGARRRGRGQGTGGGVGHDHAGAGDVLAGD